MARRDEQQSAGAGGSVIDRWWVDRDRKERSRAARSGEGAVRRNSIDRRFFRSGDGYDQDRAHARLTDINRKILEEANPVPGTWAYLPLAERPFASEDRDRILKRLELPSFVYGVCVDSGKTLRFILTTHPVGARIVELVLGRNPSLDVWIDGEWVHESVFSDREAALRAFPEVLARYLSPEAIARWDETRVQA